MSATSVSAASRLRDKVLEDINVVLLYKGGEPDKVIRVIPIPQGPLEEFGRRDGARQLVKEALRLNLDNGPQAAAWEEIERQIYLLARRDRPIERPKPVSPNSKEEWQISPDEVPTVTLIETPQNQIPQTPAPQEVAKPEPVPASFACEDCGKAFENTHKLRAHRMGKHKKGGT